MKEETKCYCGHTTYCDCGPKQETLEEYIENYNKLPNGVFKTYVGGYIDGVKWQQERSYSEEEVNNIFYAICKHSFFEDNVETVYIQDVKDEFEQFKKKV